MRKSLEVHFICSQRILLILFITTLNNGINGALANWKFALSKLISKLNLRQEANNYSVKFLSDMQTDNTLRAFFLSDAKKLR